MKKLIAILALCALLLVGGCSPKDPGQQTETPLAVTGDVEVAVLSIGKADAIVITTQNKTVVIDAGESDDGGKILNYLAEKGRSVIDLFIITHYDRDHVGGADRLLNFAEVKQILRPDYTGVREEYDLFLQTAQELQVPDTALPCGGEDVTLTVEDLEFTINSPLKSEYVNKDGIQQDNNFSLVVRMRHGANAFVFAGDAEDERLAELVVSKKNWSAAFLKLPYHGNFTDLASTFFQMVKPDYAVACDSDKNPMAAETSAALATLGCKSYATRNGTVVCHSDGVTLTLTQTKDE